MINLFTLYIKISILGYLRDYQEIISNEIKIMRKIIREIKKFIKSILGLDFYPKINYLCRKKRFGSEYGGWEVAYEYLNKDSIVYSFGVGEDASFDIALIEKYGLTIHAFDPTPRSIEWVKRQNFPPNFVMHTYGIANFDGKAFFYPPENPEHVSHTILRRVETQNNAITVPVKRLSTIMRELGHDHIDVLKMDVEGAEYNVIEDMKYSKIRPKQILVELHHRFPNASIRYTKKAYATLKKMGYGLFSVSTRGEDSCFILKTP
jgi:FkbM family methyltransferase